MMTEKERMLSGKPYLAFEDTLLEERQRAKGLIYEINTLHPFKLDERRTLLKELLGKTGENFFVEPPFRCDYGYNIEIGENFYSNYNCTILDCTKVTIGNNVLFAPNVSLFTAGHPIDATLRAQEYEYAFPITIGNDVWIGGNTVINPGVTIGSNVVIGSGSVITKDIPSNCIAAGNPCRVIRDITEEDKQYYYKKLKFDR
nr:sugar O-acetyltransferase [Turicibacter sanguinis]